MLNLFQHPGVWLTDPELMILIKDGDYSAFDELYDRYGARVRRFVFSLTRVLQPQW